MQSGVGDQTELQRFGISVVQRLPGVRQNFQDHFAVRCIWEYPQPLAPRSNACEAVFFWGRDSSLAAPAHPGDRMLSGLSKLQARWVAG